ncbi:hypothetical protein Pmani_021614 [Petrolisthes manimaculis]|uniref:Uncharacterized protein n=1 Tax=Petrolisthes manimaculis TaxID=1843537 RepID=A0AAE1PDR4_9EUCA|nr:hypothetical protein Pmani_021614 [Petrolisthes manimaculis]
MNTTRLRSTHTHPSISTHGHNTNQHKLRNETTATNEDQTRDPDFTWPSPTLLYPPILHILSHGWLVGF